MASFSERIGVSVKPVLGSKVDKEMLRTVAEKSLGNFSVTSASAPAQPFLSGNTLYIVGGVAAILVIAILIVLFKK